MLAAAPCVPNVEYTQTLQRSQKLPGPPAGAPVLEVEPQDTTVRSGDDVALQCQATGEPAPTIEWLRAGRTLRASRRLRTLPDGSLWLKRVEVGDAGVYECIAHNLLGSATAQALLVVRGRGHPSPDLQGQRGAALHRGLLMHLAHWGPGLLPCPSLIPSLSHRQHEPAWRPLCVILPSLSVYSGGD